MKNDKKLYKNREVEAGYKMKKSLKNYRNFTVLIVLIKYEIGKFQLI